MTEDYKEQLLNYITDNITPETSENIPIFEDVKTYENNFDDFVKDSDLGDYDYWFSGYLQTEDNSNYLIYGYYADTPHQVVYKSFFVIVDANLNPIKLLYKYDTGTLFRQFDKLNIDEDGNIYGVDYTYQYDGYGNVINEQRRFIMLNNILTSNLSYGDYTAVLRKSYIMSYTHFETSQIYKDNDSSTYVMVGTNIVGAETKLSIVTLKINVGEENEWNIYNSSYNYSSTIGSYIIWGNDTFEVKIVTSVYHQTSPKYLEILFNGSTYSQVSTYNLPIITTANYSYVKNVVFKNFNDIYYQLGSFKIILKTNHSTNSYDYVYNEETPAGIIRSCNIRMTNINNNILIGIYTRDNDDGNITNYLSFGLMIDDEVYLTDEFETNYIDVALFMVKNNFNLYELMYQSGNYLYNVALDYNSFNYNGLPYKDYNSLISHKGRLYSDNRLIFARNLYNKTSLNNATVSTIEIPGGMLNNINIDDKQLLGETNLTLIDDNNTITKNVYETVFLNFIDSINVIDEDTNTKYPITSNYINENINTGTKTNSQNTSVNKVRINYIDNTTKVFDIEWEVLDSTHRKIEFGIYANKDITSIDFISNNETTIYCTKELEVEVGNYYKITQYLRME